ncbi:OsmC family protein [Shewanella donghaensis]|uniref:OsmC family protein n=1 Tax=Shewanella donghaensis TaxID=238836 RepID=UPI0011835E91|nr:OsmC family protein [Shewanella donghaensis]
MGFKLTVKWQADHFDHAAPEFNRDHQIEFGSGQVVQASSAPEYKGNEANVNPEESLLAALSSCHMLTFLAIAHLKRLTVETYVDNAKAELGKSDNGKLSVTKMTLNPEITFVEGVEVSQEVIKKIHEKAHANCFIANSVKSEVEING